jgi:hypothetical protein
MLNGAAKQACKRLKLSWEREREKEMEEGLEAHLDSTTKNASETLERKFREQPQSNSCPL